VIDAEAVPVTLFWKFEARRPPGRLWSALNSAILKKRRTGAIEQLPVFYSAQGQGIHSLHRTLPPADFSQREMGIGTRGQKATTHEIGHLQAPRETPEGCDVSNW
jgi:hypothetical protein